MMDMTLYDKLGEGYVEAWGDPEAIFELMANAGDLYLLRGAFHVAVGCGVGRKKWTPDALNLVSHVLSGGYAHFDIYDRMNLAISASVQDEAMRRRVLGFILGKDVLDVRSGNMYSGELGVHSRRVIDGLLSYVHGGELDVGRRGRWDFRTPLHYKAMCLMEDIAMGREISVYDFVDTLCKIGARRGDPGFVLRSIEKEFPDPIIWVPDYMLKNSRRRR